ncbi:hypothetical protein BC827DRAFT_1196331 [Russula dissimulans]|nr:hypothetical protein BC827DRAFT_1196331 [Russula dissimulans]
MSSHTTDSTTENLLFATEYFRGIVKMGEKSPRVLQLTETIIRLTGNPTHYFCLVCAFVSLHNAHFLYLRAARQYRYETLITISAPLEPELALTNAPTIASPKAYQVWLILTTLRDPVPELAFNQEILKVSAKNYHTWSHRQWLLAHFDQPELWGGELPFVERLLAEDVWNNSAWHHRFFVTSENGDKAGARHEAMRHELAAHRCHLSSI